MHGNDTVLMHPTVSADPSVSSRLLTLLFPVGYSKHAQPIRFC